MGVGRIFSRAEPQGDFSQIFPGGAKVVNFYVSHSKLRKQPFLLKISKSRGAKASPATPFRRPWQQVIINIQVHGWILSKSFAENSNRLPGKQNKLLFVHNTLLVVSAVNKRSGEILKRLIWTSGNTHRWNCSKPTLQNE